MVAQCAVGAVQRTVMGQDLSAAVEQREHRKDELPRITWATEEKTGLRMQSVNGDLAGSRLGLLVI